MQDYKSLCIAVMICATLVNTQTHRHTAVDQLYYYLSQLSRKNDKRKGYSANAGNNDWFVAAS